MSTTAAEARELVALSSRVLASQGHEDLIWGHASMRDPSGRGAWLKSADWAMSEVTPDRVHLVSPAGEVLSGSGPRHNEYPIHTEIMAARPDVAAVVHTHSPHALALAASGQPLRPVSHAATMFVPPEVPRFTDTSDLILDADLGRRLALVLGPSKAVFLVNHGIVTVGSSVQAATVTAVLLEQACRQQLMTAGFGGWPTWTSSAESARKRRHFDNPTAIHAVWDYLVRTLPPM